jgi:hypothetical protein
MVTAKIKCMNHENHTFHIKSLLKRFVRAAFALGSLCSAHAAQQVSLAWDASPEPNIAGYRLRYGTQSGTYTETMTINSGTTASVEGLTSGATYYFVVTAYDQAGLESLPSNEAIFQTIGNIAPSVTLTGPANGGSFHTPASVTLNATASDSDGSVTKVEFYVGAQKVGEATSAPYSVNVNATLVGDYNVSAVAYDNLGATAQALGSFQVSKLAVSTTRRNTNGTFELTINGAPGHTNRIWVSNDLQTWTVLQDVTNTTGTLVFTDTEAANHSQRFYKISAD